MDGKESWGVVEAAAFRSLNEFKFWWALESRQFFEMGSRGLSLCHVSPPKRQRCEGIELNVVVLLFILF